MDLYYYRKQIAAKDAEIERLKEGTPSNRVLLAQVKELQRELAEARAYIIRNHNSDYKDYACAQCDPDGEIVVPGFVCQFHKAVKKD